MNQIQELTHEQQVELYNACSKAELIEMLIEANRVLNKLNNQPKSLDYTQMSKDFDTILQSHSKEYVEKWLELDEQRLLSENVVSLEVAKLLKSRGFTKKCKFFYQDIDLPYSPKGLKHCKNGLTLNHNKYDECIYSAPSIKQYNNWLKHDYRSIFPTDKQ